MTSIAKNVTLTISFQDGRPSTQVSFRSGLGLQAVAARFPDAVPIEFDCRKADCGVCLFLAQDLNPQPDEANHSASFLSPTTYQERDYLKAMGCHKGERLACQARVLADGTMTILPP